jgi:ABC-2 type transport system ATP-binding protein
VTVSGLADDAPRPVDMPVATLDRASVRHGAIRAVEAVSLALWPGEVYVLMGPNGSGKSSLAGLLTGTLRPESGAARVLGASAGGDGHGRRAVSLVPQEIALYPWLTARENCLAFARVAGLGRHEAAARADQALALARCEDVADRRVARLSGGYKRRVNIAAALVNEPRLLVLDEPTVGVDLGAKRAIAATIKTLRAMDAAILLITHDFEDADALADRAGFLVGGRLVGEGAPTALVSAIHGASKRIEIILAAPPNAAETRALREAGARPTATDTVWLMFRAIADWNAGAVIAALEAAGLVIAELRLRDPGLETLYGHFCEPASDP